MNRKAKRSLERLLPRLEASFAGADGSAWGLFRTRLLANFEHLFDLLLHLYGEQFDFFYHLETILQTAARLWLARPAELKALDAQREADPLWFQSQEMVGGVCYVDLFAGSLAGIRARIPYFQELGLTYLHLMPLFKSPEGDNDGGYAVIDYRQITDLTETMHMARCHYLPSTSPSCPLLWHSHRYPYHRDSCIPAPLSAPGPAHPVQLPGLPRTVSPKAMLQ